MPSEITLLSLDDIGCHEDIAETEETIEGNAVLKARYVFDNYHYPCFADDTGLEVNVLNGAPGVYSARYAGPEKDADANTKKLLRELKAENDRSARFKTVIAFIDKSGVQRFEGICNGVITEYARGEKGFGYDPVFLPDGYSQTFAEMDMEVKGAISHRGLAINKLVDHLSS